MTKITEFNDYLSTIDDPIKRQQLTAILQWVIDEFPTLEPRIAWNQPMFTDHGTFIIGFSVAKNHFSVAPEGEVIDHFDSKIGNSGYSRGKQLMKILWSQEVDYDLLHEMIAFNIQEKANCSTFWRK